MCKELMYKIAYNEKLDWIMKLNWSYIAFPPMVIFLLLLNFKTEYLSYILPLYIPVEFHSRS